MLLHDRVGVVSRKITRIYDVEDDCKDDASTVDAESDPPKKLLV